MKRVSEIGEDLSHIRDTYFITTCGRLVEVEDGRYKFNRYYQSDTHPQVKLKDIYDGLKSLYIRVLVGRAYIDKDARRFSLIDVTKRTAVPNVVRSGSRLIIKNKKVLGLAIPKGAYIYYPDANFKTIAFYGRRSGDLLGVVDVSRLNKNDILDYLIKNL